MTQMQGIVSILRSDNLEKTTKVSPLRRTLSADMSSKRWLAENRLPMKITSSTEQMAMDSCSSSESDDEECDKNPSRMDIWTAIMSQKKQEDSPPHVHPLVNKSGRSLSDNSLKVCTESLGSETGSDVVFMFNPVDAATGEKPQPQPQPQPPEQNKVVKHASLTTNKKAQVARTFPPPLPSLHADEPSLHMHSRRVEGRLVLEAVSVPPQKYFQAQRQDGRFLLTLLINEPIQPNEFVDMGTMKEPPLIDSTITIKKIAERSSRKLNTNITTTKLQVTDQEQSLPGRPPLPRPPSVNSYHYFWRSKQSVINPMITQHRPPTKTKHLLLLRDNIAAADCCLIPASCKESLVMWDPFCIPTS